MAVWQGVAYLSSATVCAAAATVTDIQSRRIPNLLTGLGVAAGLALHLMCGGMQECGLSLLAGLLAGSAFFVFFLAGGMGAGDVKLMTAIGCLAGLHPLTSILTITVVAGAVAAAITAAVHGRLRETLLNVREIFAHHQVNGLSSHPEIHVRNRSLLRLPYALSVAAGCVATLILNLHGSISQ